MLFRTIYIANVLAATFSLCIADETITAEESVITLAPAPELVKRNIQKRDPYGGRSDFIGYYESGTAYYPAYCYGDTYSETYVGSTWYGGCQGTDSYMTLYTSCSGDYAYGFSRYMSGTYSGSKSYMSVSCYDTCWYDYLDSGGASLSYFAQCQSEAPFTFYRMSSTDLALYLDLTISIPTTAPVTPTPVPITPTTTPTPTPTPNPSPITSPTPLVTPLPAPSPEPTPKKKVKIGPIIGAAIGGVAILAAIAFGIFALIRKRRNPPNNFEDQNQPVMIKTEYLPGGPAVMMPEKAAVSPSVTDYSSSPQSWAPSPQGNPQQGWVPYPQAHQQESNPGYAGVSPPASPPPPGYFPGQPQPQSAHP